MKMNTKEVAVGLVIIGLVACIANGAVVIDFSTYPNGSIPGNFDEITFQYIEWGVIFASIPGSEATQVTTLWMPQQLLFPGGTGSEHGGTLILDFVVDVNYVESDLYNIDIGPIDIFGYDKDNKKVASTTGSGSSSWSLEYENGIARVELIGNYFSYPDDPDGWAIRNLRYTAIPEPTMLLLLGLGAVILKRKR